jgi:hypothetical protein
MFLKLKNGNLINLDLVSDVILHETRKTVTLMGYQLVLATESREAYEYYYGKNAQAKIVEVEIPETIN